MKLLGLAWHDGALYATQRSEVTRLRDTDGDGVADEYLTAAKGWGVSGNYHEYAYGPVFDPQRDDVDHAECDPGRPCENGRASARRSSPGAAGP